VSEWKLRLRSDSPWEHVKDTFAQFRDDMEAKEWFSYRDRKLLAERDAVHSMKWSPAYG
jgi:hypothetical protein